jgi:hypothetical protein
LPPERIRVDGKKIDFRLTKLDAFSGASLLRMLRPVLERLLPVLMMSCFLYVPENMGFVFNPLATVTPAETEELARSLSSRVRELFEAGIITREEARAELRGCGEKYAAWRGI